MTNPHTRLFRAAEAVLTDHDNPQGHGVIGLELLVELANALAAVEAQPPAIPGTNVSRPEKCPKCKWCSDITVTVDGGWRCADCKWDSYHQAKLEAQPPAAQVSEQGEAMSREAFYNQEQHVNALLAKIDAQASRIAALEGALRQAIDLISTPASRHHDGREPITGTPRYSAGLLKHHKECHDLLPVLKQALSGAAQ